MTDKAIDEVFRKLCKKRKDTEENCLVWTLDFAEFRTAVSQLLEEEERKKNNVIALYDRMRENWKQVCASDVFQELKHGKYRQIMAMLAEGEISVGKAAETIAQLAHSGECSPLPELADQRDSQPDPVSNNYIVEALRDDLPTARERMCDIDGPRKADTQRESGK